MMQPLGLGATRISGQDQHVEYEIKVGGVTRSWRRYREFDELAKQLKKLNVSCSFSFPPKRLFGNNSTPVVAERISGLDKWLNATISFVDRRSPAAEVVKTFLMFNPWVEEAAAVSSSANGQAIQANKKDTRLKEIINRFVTAASAPAQYTSLSKVGGSGKAREEAEASIPPLDLSEFRRSLEKAESVFQVIRSSRT
jgi:hypothetical protein